MTSRSTERFKRFMDNRAPIFEPIATVAIISLLTSWAIQPFVARALAQHGTAAQGAAEAALWLSGVLSPMSAFAKAFAATLVCWGGAVFINERVAFVKLLSAFCIAELVFSLRDVAMVSVLASRGLENVRTTSDLMVAFGLGGFLHPQSALARIGIESWDAFTLAWAALSFWMIRALFKTDVRSSACIALVALAFRTLFTAASHLYTL